MSEMSKKQQSTIRNSEQGLVAILTTIVLMMVITLIVLGFAQIARRNQRESLDRQLSTQAFYAAESGVNDASRLIRRAVAAGRPVEEKTACDGSGVGGFYAELEPVVDAGRNVRFTCLLVDPAPRTLRFSDIGTTSTVVPIISFDGTAINTLNLNWQPKSSGVDPLIGCPTPTGNSLTPSANWNCGYGVLRFDLVPTAGVLDIETLNNSTMTTFALPYRAADGTDSISYQPAAANGNNKIGAKCTADSCTLTVTGLSANNYHLRVSSLYKSAGLQVTATGAAGNRIRIAGAQAVIDATGKAQDVLRRIQVNMPYRLTNENQLSDYAVETNGSICKRYSIMPGYTSIDGGGVTSTNPLCQDGVTH